MTIGRVIHEGGLTAGSLTESTEIQQKYQLRPVLLIDTRSQGSLELLMAKNGGALSIQASSLYSSSPTPDGALLMKTFALAYDVGASLHHCTQLSKAYESIVNTFRRISDIPGFDTSESSLSSFGYQHEPYYELDALLSAARRAYDKLGHCVWHSFEGAGGGRPDNMTELLDRLKSCPPTLSDRLRHSWFSVGARLKDYRDCTQHFASVDMGLGTVMMKRLTVATWRAWARIPDNPEAKSRKKFTYALNFDALTYGWEVTNEVAALAIEVMTAVGTESRREKDASAQE